MNIKLLIYCVLSCFILTLFSVNILANDNNKKNIISHLYKNNDPTAKILNDIVKKN